jgi:hypothetical protein
MTNETLKSVLVEQFNYFTNRSLGIEREVLKQLKKSISSPQVLVITGLRRVGKSTLLAQIAHKYLLGKFYYINFEDERLTNFTSSDFDSLFELLISIFGNKNVFLIDEIQNILGWERFVRRLSDQGFKFIITGSNASLLSQELGTRLTGRHEKIEVFPFSFIEYLSFKKYKIPKLDILTTSQKGKLRMHQSEYISSGGIIDSIKYPDINIHKSLYNDVLYRDIATRYSIDNIKALKELTFYLISNISTLISFNKLKEMLMLGSVNTVKSYIEYLETSWLFFTINKFAFSVKEQQIAAKKIYSIDTGLAKSIGFSFSKNLGKLIENIIFLHLRKMDKNVYYYRTADNLEVDFYIPELKTLIQSAYHLDKTNIDRETRALIKASQEIKSQSTVSNRLIIITENIKDVLKIDGETIEVIPLYLWLLQS